jgi:hypothetical protein
MAETRFRLLEAFQTGSSITVRFADSGFHINLIYAESPPALVNTLFTVAFINQCGEYAILAHRGRFRPEVTSPFNFPTSICSLSSFVLSRIALPTKNYWQFSIILGFPLMSNFWRFRETDPSKCQAVITWLQMRFPHKKAIKRKTENEMIWHDVNWIIELGRPKVPQKAEQKHASLFQWHWKRWFIKYKAVHYVWNWHNLQKAHYCLKRHLLSQRAYLRDESSTWSAPKTQKTIRRKSHKTPIFRLSTSFNATRQFCCAAHHTVFDHFWCRFIDGFTFVKGRILRFSLGFHYSNHMPLSGCSTVSISEDWNRDWNRQGFSTAIRMKHVRRCRCSILKLRLILKSCSVSLLVPMMISFENLKSRLKSIRRSNMTFAMQNAHCPTVSILHEVVDWNGYAACSLRVQLQRKSTSSKSVCRF